MNSGEEVTKRDLLIIAMAQLWEIGRADAGRSYSAPADVCGVGPGGRVAPAD
jgi:hypothetical protein